MRYLKHILFDTPLAFMLVLSAIFAPIYFGLTYLVGAWSWDNTGFHLFMLTVLLFLSLGLTFWAMIRLAR